MKRCALAPLVAGFVAFVPVCVSAEGLDCPATGRTAISALLAGDSQIQRMTTNNDVDLGNEIGGLIQRIRREDPAISYDDIVDLLTSVYCPVVSRMTDVSTAGKWQLMRQFDRVLMQQAMQPHDSAIAVSVPLPPAVYRELINQAQASGQSVAGLMTAILTRATGQ